MSFQAIFCLLHKTLLLFIKALFYAPLIHVRLSFRPCSHSISFPSAFVAIFISFLSFLVLIPFPFHPPLFHFHILSIIPCSLLISFPFTFVPFSYPFYPSLFSLNYLSFFPCSLSISFPFVYLFSWFLSVTFLLSFHFLPMYYFALFLFR